MPWVSTGQSMWQLSGHSCAIKYLLEPRKLNYFPSYLYTKRVLSTEGKKEFLIFKLSQIAMPGQGVGQSTTQVDEMDVVLKSSEPVHFASPTYSKCRAISHRLVDRVEAFWLKSHPLGHPTCLVQNSHFQSQTNMVLSQFCKGPKSCCIQLII